MEILAQSMEIKPFSRKKAHNFPFPCILRYGVLGVNRFGVNEVFSLALPPVQLVRLCKDTVVFFHCSWCSSVFRVESTHSAWTLRSIRWYGEVILRLLCDAQQRRTLDAILADGLHEGIPNWRVENDAIDSEGNPVLFAYTCDFPRIRRFDTALELHGMTGTLICFDYQEEALREICGQCVMLQSIDFQQFERSVLYS